jgi:leucyl/phenylalanyl-tRNA--protein transferase
LLLSPNSQSDFPPVHEADEDGLLAIGGDLSTERLIKAYSSGIFPWFKDRGLIYWYSTDPRCVLFPDKLKISKSMVQLMRKGVFEYRFNEHFREVITQCGQMDRGDQSGSWIDKDYVEAYTKLHVLGFAVSGETWLDGELVGGCYGVWLNGVWFGESMFAKISNASKFAFIKTIEVLKAKGLRLVDCQQETDHLKSLGAELITRDLFLKALNTN